MSKKSALSGMVAVVGMVLIFEVELVEFGGFLG
jgi:hypothetical protein